MNNHIHLLIQPMNPDLSKGMHILGFRYARHFNSRYGKKGYLYQGRFKAILVQNEKYLLTLVRYIHLNPVRANIVRNPTEYFWSSHNAYRNQQEFAWLTKNLVINSFNGLNNEFKNSFNDFVNTSTDLLKEELKEIRKSSRIGAYGDSLFVQMHKDVLLNNNSNFINQSNLRKKIDLDTLISFVCDKLGTSCIDICSPSRTKTLVKARTLIALIGNMFEDFTISNLASKINRDPTSISRLLYNGKKDTNLSIIANEWANLLGNCE